MAGRGGIVGYAALAALVAGIAFAGWWLRAPSPTGSGDRQAGIVVPRLSAAAEVGKEAYDGNCARCHGANAAGTSKGPPLIHKYYHPGHHADGAFFAAVARGVPQHHWKFGNMPAQPHVTEQQTRMIVRYVRELQEANGIRYEPR